MLLDSHAHLYDLNDNEFSDMIDRANNANISSIINIGTNITTSKKIITQKSTNDAVELFSAVGICPPEINTADNNWVNELKTLIQDPSVIAIGEIGIDGINESYPPMEEQLPFFKQQLQIAIEADLPVVIHARGAETAALNICKEMKITKAIFHCFTGSIDEAKAIVEAGYIISFSGIITFKNSDFDQMVSEIPDNQLLLETDSPYLAPVPFRGKTNEPSFVANIYEYAAQVRNSSVESLAVQCKQTFQDLFAL